jgi:predicted lipoprotein
MSFTKPLLSLLGATVLLIGCVSDDKGDPEAEIPVNPIVTLESAIGQVVDNAIVPSVEGFLAAAEALNAAAETFCTNPDEAKLSDMQDNWRATFEQWFRLSIYNFGPLNDDIVFPQYTFIDSLRLRGTDYLETVRSEIAADIDDSDSLNNGYFISKTFQRVGLLALESAIFETSTAEHSNNPSDVVNDYSFQPRKCEVLQGLSGQLAHRARYVEQGWKVAHLNSELPYRTLFLDGQLDDGTEPLTQVLISSQKFLDYLQARRVVVIAASISMHAWQVITATINEVELLLRGNENTTDSLFDVMEATGNQNAVAAVEDSIDQVRQAIADRDMDMLEISLGYLDGNFKREIPDSLELDLGINFSDGD